jgi:potassium-transporting ATPase KdpC subunit
MNKNIRASALLFVLSIVVCCIAYPLVVWVIGTTLFSDKAEGSLIRAKGSDGVERIVGSRLIAQPFTNDEYFWPRPSGAGTPYNAAAAGASNWGANNPKLRDRVAQQLGSMIKYKAGSASAGAAPEPRTPQQDIEAWFAAKPERLADWANEYSVGTAGWAKTDYDTPKDKYGLQGEYILAWAKDHPEIVDDWKKANPTKTDEPKPEDLATNFFVSYSAANPGKWPGVVEDEKTKEKKIAPVTSDAALAANTPAIAANFFDMWLQDPVNAAKAADLEPVPADMVTASGSGLDPNITLRNALSVYQLDRVAAKRTPAGKSIETTKESIAKLAKKLSFTPLSGLAGEPLVNVLELNVELDAMWPLPAPTPVAVGNLPGPAKEVVAGPMPPAKEASDVAARIRDAQLRVERGEIAAVDQLKKLVEADPASAEVRFALGTAYLHFGQFRPAANAFREAAERSPVDSPGWIAADNAARDALQWAGLERRLPEILTGAVTATSPRAWADFGNVCRYTGRFAAAARFFAKAAGDDGKYAQAAATCAALAGFNIGSDAKELTDETRTQLRRAALTALRAHREWAKDSALTPLKSPEVIASVSPDERITWEMVLSNQDSH